MKPELINIKKYEGPGYFPLVSFNNWRVAVLRYMDACRPDRIDGMERHMASDEVFVLVEGQAVLVLGGNGNTVDVVTPVPMEKGVVYNVKKGTWHNVVMSRGVHILVVENDDTGEGNSEHCQLSAPHRAAVRNVVLG